MPDTQPVLYVVACGGYPSGHLAGFVAFAKGQGWDVCVIATPDGMKFLDAPALAGLTGHPVRSQYKDPGEADVLPPADAFVVAPATFNTVNKWARGISDTLALGLLNEATGQGLPIVAAPWPNANLMRHPAFQRSIADLRGWGVQVILDPERPAGAAAFPWDQVRAKLPGLPGDASRRQAG
jgi:phosphopantothenoylcysteine synthetase/decarboxylase